MYQVKKKFQSVAVGEIFALFFDAAQKTYQEISFIQKMEEKMCFTDQEKAELARMQIEPLHFFHWAWLQIGRKQALKMRRDPNKPATMSMLEFIAERDKKVLQNLLKKVKEVLNE